MSGRWDKKDITLLLWFLIWIGVLFFISIVFINLSRNKNFTIITCKIEWESFILIRIKPILREIHIHKQLSSFRSLQEFYFPSEKTNDFNKREGYTW